MNLPAGELAELPVELLASVQNELDHSARQLKAANARFNTALEIRYAARAEEARREAGKDTGTVRLADGDVTIVADLPKKIEWDQAQLTALVARIRSGGEDPAEYVSTRLEVAERAFAAWPESIRQLFAPARTVRTGKPSFRFVPNGSAA
jgi:hypothetical protein